MSTRTSILLITVDALRADYLSSYGCEIETPNIDKIGKDGVLFSNAFSNGSGTSSGFRSIFSSSYDSDHVSYLHGGLSFEGLNPSIPTLAEVLSSAGYNCIGLTAGNPFLSTFFGRGFNVFDRKKATKEGMIEDSSSPVTSLSLLSHFLQEIPVLWRIARYIKHTLGVVPNPRADTIVEQALSSLESVKKPFFLWVHFMDVHIPYLPPNLSLSSRLRAARLDDKLMFNWSSVTDNELKSMIDLYKRNVEYVDQCLDPLLRKIYEISGDDICIVFTSDHGDEFLEHGALSHASPHLYDEQIHVPLIIKHPQLQHQTVTQQISLLDLAPTILGFSGIGINKCWRGKDLSNHLLKGNLPEGPIVCEAHEQGFYYFAIRTQDFKYIRKITRNGAFVGDEMFNLKRDPQERTNILNSVHNSPIIGQLCEHIDSQLEKMLPMEESEDFDFQSVRRRLRELGYL
jgi:arylsulfatase A-like enzyme